MGKSEKEDICLGTLLAVGACVLTEEHHVILSASGNYAVGFAPKEEREKVREGSGGVERI